MIDIDGNVWLLFADGRLLKFYGGEQKPFELKGLPDPLSARAGSPQADGDLIYIADSGNGRILEFTKDGQFQRQFDRLRATACRGFATCFSTRQAISSISSPWTSLWKADVPRAPSASKAAPSK